MRAIKCKKGLDIIMSYKQKQPQLFA